MSLYSAIVIATVLMSSIDRKRAPEANIDGRTGDIKKPRNRVSSTSEMNESDVSLSDDDADEIVSLQRKTMTTCSKRDGNVPVPPQSSVFLKIIEQKERLHLMAEASFTESGSHSGPHHRSTSNTLHASLPIRQVSSLSRNQQNQQRAIQNTTNASKVQPQGNSILNASKSISMRKDGKDLRLVGSVLINSKSLVRNSSNVLVPSLSTIGTLKTGNAVLDKIHFNKSEGTGVKVTNSSNPSERQKMLKREKIIAERDVESLEIELLLGQKSSHAEERESEWFEGFEQRTAKLVEKEEIRKKMATVVSSFVRAFHCSDCKILTESSLAAQLCSTKKHSVSTVRGVKWYFECAVCKRSESTLSAAPSSASNNGRSTGKGDPNDNRRKPNQLPDTEIVSGMSSKQHPTVRCQCGGFSWRSCSKYGSNEGKSIQADQRIILSASEWTSRKDLSSLDCIRSSVL